MFFLRTRLGKPMWIIEPCYFCTRNCCMSHIDISTCTYSKVLASRSLSKCTSPVNLPLYSKLHNGSVSCRIFDWYLILALNSIGLIQTDWEYKFDPSQLPTIFHIAIWVSIDRAYGAECRNNFHKRPQQDRDCILYCVIRKSKFQRKILSNILCMSLCDVRTYSSLCLHIVADIYWYFFRTNVE